MELSIIIVNWKSSEYLKRCIASIKLNTVDLDYEIVVIDSASFDGCDQMLRENFPAVRFIQSEINLGFARANNLAFRASLGRSVLFLNPDTEVIGPSINLMLKHLWSLPAAGSIGCKLLNSDFSVQTSCIQSLPTILNQMLDSEFLRARWPDSSLWGMSALHSGESQPQQVSAVSGACVMLKRQVFEQVGMFSEDYFMYAEDIDLSYKLGRRGFVNYFAPCATVVHHGGGSSKGAASQFAAVMMREAVLHFLSKTRGWLYGLGYRVAMFASAVVRTGALALAWPLERRRPDLASWKNSLQKWSAVLRWSLRRERTLAKYRQGSSA